MKFLCVACDEPMTLTDTRGPDDGSMAVLFGCPTCGHEIAMLTNPMETQMVRSLGVKIGGRTAPAAPMETVRHGLLHRREEAPSEAGAEAARAPAAGGGCPFTGVVTDAFSHQAPAAPRWTAEAEGRVARIPSFAQPMVRQGVEQYAREKGYAEITDAVMDEVRGRFGM